MTVGKALLEEDAPPRRHDATTPAQAVGPAGQAARERETERVRASSLTASTRHMI
jgi:hypothetical protein